jgi:hypothetical protein
VDFSLIDWEAPMPGLRHKSVNAENKQIRLVEYTKRNAPSLVRKDALWVRPRWNSRVEYLNETVVYNPGDFILIPHGPEHKHMGKTLTERVRGIFVEDI